MIRVQKAISQAGLMSRRAAEDLIRAGRVTVDGRQTVLGDRVDPDSQVVEVDGVPMPVAPGLVTYLLYKPVGVISTADDTHGRPTVVGLVPDEPRVWPVGRLDADSEGLILVSNDGELTNRATHPSFGLTKRYLAMVDGAVGSKAARRLTAGVDLEDGPAAARSARVIEVSGSRSLVEVVMTEGRNREVRRMFDAIGHPVQRLTRVAIGPLEDRSLGPGEWRRLTSAEIRSLYEAASARD